ncbi:heat shock 70 kDa protein 12A-like isoform X2 [Ostrea edulis]|uniref:heat shock 70 kDa protein 12A-like isoform X2 n=1 Tax=Ostrea edulis TaxID=37623 RepID=UPI0024AFE909|nr:heat shock 70 kDa protein 12A-like isoform X2 [Ostrea edulis]
MGNCCSKKENPYTVRVSAVGVENPYTELNSPGGVNSEEIYAEILETNVTIQRLGRYPVIAAIDFGTTYSGYAFAMNSSDTKIQLPTWAGSETMTNKAPTAVLFKPDKSFFKFGHDAITYMEDNPDGEDLDFFYFFHDFKMLLYRTENLSLNTKIQDVTGQKYLPAIVVFSSVIRYFTDHLISNLFNRFGGSSLEMTDIFWVITVPAIWSLKAKYFMREAAEQAGIPVKQLAIALEPEAASVLCRTVEVYVSSNDGMEGVKKSPCSIPDNSTYLVIDIGGGTVDITLHQVRPGRGLRELYQASGGDYGGNQVNKRFLEFITKLFGEEVIEAVKQKHPSDWVEIHNNFEHKKRASTKFDDQDKIVIRFPVTFDQAYKSLMNTNFQERIKRMGYEGQITLKKDKLILTCKIFKSFFEFSLSGIKKCIERVLEHGHNTNTIMFVGGFAESPYLIDMLRKYFCNYKVLVPEDPSLVVLRGAVLFGFDPTIIQSRICRYTYGIANQRPFIDGKDKIEKRRKHNGGYYCDDVFDKHVEIGEMLEFGKFQEPKDYHPLNAEQVNVMLELYASTEKDPIYVDDPSCHLVGVMEIEVQERKPGEDGTVLVSVNFSGTELEIKAYEKRTGNVTTSACNFLG